MVKIAQYIIDTDSVLIATDIALRLQKKYNKIKGTVQYNGEKVNWYLNTLENENETIQNEQTIK